MSELVETQEHLNSVISSALQSDRYAIDTEFHREKTYFPKAALVQLYWGEQVALLDPLALNLNPLKQLLQSDALCIMHACLQDLEVLERACGAVPTRILDTQVAAGFLGFSSASLSSLMAKYLDIILPKSSRLTNWLARPLTEKQQTYAASDVLYLLKLTDVLSQLLEAKQRMAWVMEESALLLDKPRGPREPDKALQRIKEARSLKGETLRVAYALAAWREERAVALDRPAKQILSDLGVVALAQKKPQQETDVVGLRGVDSRSFNGETKEAIFAAVRKGKAAEPAAVKEKPKKISSKLRPFITLVTSWIAQVARDNQLDPALLATRSDVEALLRESSHCRLREGWRAEMLGKRLEHLLAGGAAIALDEQGKLILEARSYQEL